MDILDGRVVKGVKFHNVKEMGDPVSMAEAYSSGGAHELAFLNISRDVKGRRTSLETIKKAADKISIPFIVGGGISCIDHIDKIFAMGASKISISTAAVNNPYMIEEAAMRYGKEKIVIAIDAKARTGEKVELAGEGWDVYIEGGRTNSGKDVLEWAVEVERLGAGEILLTSMDKDGTKDGFDIELTSIISKSIGIPVIASGGAGTKDDFYQVLTDGNASAALAASIFHYNEIKIEELKRYLKDKGLVV